MSDHYVFNIRNLTKHYGKREILKDINLNFYPGAKIGVIGSNGSGKTTLLRLLVGEREPDHGTVRRGRTLQVGYLSQAVSELAGSERVLASVERLRRRTQLAGGGEAGVSSLLEDFGFTGERLSTRLDDLSGGERRRLQFLRLLLDEPNVLLLDEPTNDLDIDTLTVIEDYLDGWPGTLIVVSHDRYFLERVCDVTYALLGDGSCVLLPGGVEEYLERRRSAYSPPGSASPAPPGPAPDTSAAANLRQARKDLARIESQLGTAQRRVDALHEQMADAAADYVRLAELQRELDTVSARQADLEEQWLAAAEVVG